MIQSNVYRWLSLDVVFFCEAIAKIHAIVHVAGEHISSGTGQ